MPCTVHDITVAHELLHGEEQIAFADAAYVGIEKPGKRERFSGTSR